MKRQNSLYLALILMASLCGCAKPKVWVSPQMDLHRFGTLGVVEFAERQGHGSMATRQFVAQIHSEQPGTAVLELGPLASVLDSVGRAALDPDAVRAIGERHHVDVLVVGDLEIAEPSGGFSIDSLRKGSASAELVGTLGVRFLDAHSGATIWSDHARGKRTLAKVSLVAGQLPNIGAVDPQGEHARLVGWLVHRVTGAFRGHWARQ